MLKFKTSCAVLAYLSSNLLNEVGLFLFRYFEVGLRVCDIVVKKFKFAISSPDKFLSTPQLDQSLVFDVRITSITDSVASFRWLRATKRIKFTRLGTCPMCSATSLICRWEVDFARLLSDFLTPALHDSSLSVIAHVLQPDYDSGTAYLKSFSLPRHQSHHFVVNWNCTYFGNHTRTLFAVSP